MIDAGDTTVFTISRDATSWQRVVIRYRYWRAERPKMLRTNTWGIGTTVDEKP